MKNGRQQGGSALGFDERKRVMSTAAGWIEENRACIRTVVIEDKISICPRI
jgi:hypothetical protein